MLRRTIERDPDLAVLEADRAATALHQLGSTPPAVILVHTPLDDGAGATFARLLRERPDHAHTPLLFLATRGTLEDVLEAVESGADEYVLMPCEPEMLLDKIRRALARTAAPTPAPSPPADDEEGAEDDAEGAAAYRRRDLLGEKNRPS